MLRFKPTKLNVTVYVLPVSVVRELTGLYVACTSRACLLTEHNGYCFCAFVLFLRHG